MIVATVDRDAEIMVKKQDEQWWHKRDAKLAPDTRPCFPFALLGQEGWEAMHPFVPVEVPKYTETELNTLIDYFVEKR